jgi:iron-sulfur cluster assembly protein
MSINFTEKAAKEARTILFEHQSDQVQALRIGIQTSGCCGFTYTVDLCYKPEPTDKIFTSHGVKIVCDPKSFLYLDGTVIDFSEKLINRGFLFKNPNARQTCPCGASFGV